MKLATASLLCLLLLPLHLFASEPIQCRAVLLDGSVVVGTLKTDYVFVATPYGSLQVPADELRSIQFGLHLSAIDAKAIASAVKTLDSPMHRERDISTKFLLQHGRRSILALMRASQSKDVEGARRAKSVLDAILESGVMAPAGHDVVTAKQMTVRGVVQRFVNVERENKDTFALEVSSRCIGDVKIPMTELVELQILSHSAVTVKIDAAEYGDKWLNTGIAVDRNTVLTLKTTGTVDLSPQQPGGFVSLNGKGYNVTGKNGIHLAGALVARIGGEGKGTPFIVGELHEGTVKEDGVIYLRVWESTWNAIASGVFTVQVEVRSR